jgi:predicted deacetylase
LISTVASSPSESEPAVAIRDRRRLLVSIHDVTPALEAQVRALWDICRRRSVVPALLVVPNWHGVSPLDRSPEFVDWLRECADDGEGSKGNGNGERAGERDGKSARGAEIFLHGLRHDEVGLPRRPADVWRAWGKTALEGEFLTLDREAARQRIDEGLVLFRRLGLTPVGFVPPAWLAQPDCDRAVADAGLRFSEDDRTVSVHEGERERRIPSPVVRWSSRTLLRAHGSAVVASIRRVVQHRSPHVRIALHPTDLDHPATARSVERALDDWLTDRQATRYSDL